MPDLAATIRSLLGGAALLALAPSALAAAAPGAAQFDVAIANGGYQDGWNDEPVEPDSDGARYCAGSWSAWLAVYDSGALKPELVAQLDADLREPVARERYEFWAGLLGGDAEAEQVYAEERAAAGQQLVEALGGNTKSLDSFFFTLGICAAEPEDPGQLAAL